jgi:hypothetical protein
MKTTLAGLLVAVLAVVAQAAALGAPPAQKSVEVVLGPKAFRDGDVIEITDVTTTSAKLEQGDSVTVRGRVRLDSRSAATLSLYLTQTEGDGLEETDASQLKEISSGLTPFEVKATIKHKGALHVSLYDPQTGKGFGGVYFGTAEQMQKIADWNVGWMSGD